MLSIAAPSMGDMDMAVTQAKEEAEGAMVDMAMPNTPPPLMVLIFQTPTAALTQQEWNLLGSASAIILQLRENHQGHGSGRGHDSTGCGQGRGCHDNECNVAAVETNEKSCHRGKQ